VVHFGETGAIQDLYRKHAIDTEAVLEAMVQVLFGRSA
jgi:pyruvate dehydrogenase complex dehydrogenase (E1) component